MEPITCVVPARINSSRFPGKPLAQIAGQAMIVRTLQRAQLAQCFAQIICATDSEIIAAVVRQAGFQAVLSPDLPTGSDRVAWVAQQLNLPFVVNLQGDEPVADLELLRQVAATLRAHPASWITAAAPLGAEQNPDSNCVKIQVTDELAQDFTRAAVNGTNWYLHCGIYGYALPSLAEFFNFRPQEKEIQAAIEPLRILGQRPIRVVHTAKPALSVDAPQDLAQVEAFLQRNSDEK